MARLFIDTGYALALALPRDQHHERARKPADEYDLPATRFVTTQGIVLEIGNSLSAVSLRPAAIKVIDGMRSDPRITIIATDDELIGRGYELFCSRLDKQWSLTDCMSFAIMQDEHLTLALTHDEHFQQAGFRALMRE